MTAVALLKALIRAGCEPAIEGPDLLLDDPPERLTKYLPILGTGLRAVLLGKPWHGITATGHNAGRDSLAKGGPLAFGSLDPADLLPPDVRLLVAWGSGRAEPWGRLPPMATTDFPECFHPQPFTRRVRP